MSRRDFFEQEKKKKMITTFSIALLLSIVAFVTVFVMYSQKLDKDAEISLLALTEDDTVVPNDVLEPTSFSDDKTVKNVTFENSIQLELENTTQNTSNIIENNEITPESKEVISPVVKEEESQDEKISEETQVNQQTSQQDDSVDLSFQAPVAGEIIKDYAMETLIYSETLDEWCTHCGIDIKADKTSIVAASEKGVVESIKNDPRYGLTIIISHGNGFKTVYSNLLTTEFVHEGEEVEKGQTIATVGESASFEIADEPHLHFEMYKDGITVNPTIYFN